MVGVWGVRRVLWWVFGVLLWVFGGVRRVL